MLWVGVKRERKMYMWFILGLLLLILEYGDL